MKPLSIVEHIKYRDRVEVGVVGRGLRVRLVSHLLRWLVARAAVEVRVEYDVAPSGPAESVDGEVRLPVALSVRRTAMRPNVAARVLHRFAGVPFPTAA